MSEITITKDNFEKEVISSDKPVLVDFWAQWCGPCQMLSPIISELSEENKDAIKVGKVNVDDEPELASLFNVSSIPTLIFFENGKAVNSLVGYRSKEQIKSELGII